MEDFLFGLKGGMTLEEVKKACSSFKPDSYHSEPGYYIIKPLKSNPIFNTYTVIFDSKGGLFEINASWETVYDNSEIFKIKEDRSPVKIKFKFLRLKRKLTKMYGKPLPYGKYKRLLKEYKKLLVGWMCGSSHLSDSVDFVYLEADYGYCTIELKVRLAGYNDSLPCKTDPSVFGFRKGMSLEEIAKECREEPSGYSYIDPKKYYPTYNTYVNRDGDSTGGLYSITLIKSVFGEYKDEIEKQLEAGFMKRRLTEIFGEPSSCDEFGSKRRFIEASWDLGEGSIIKGIESIFLKSDNDSISVDFRFDNLAKIKLDKERFLFGLRMEMTLEDVRDACGGEKPKHIKKDLYQIKPIKGSSSLFKKYIAFIDREKGLYEFRAEQYAPFSSDGIEERSVKITPSKVKKEYNNLRDILSECYDDGDYDNSDNNDEEFGSKMQTQWNNRVSSLPFDLYSVSLLYDKSDIFLRCSFNNISESGVKGFPLFGLRIGMTLEEVKEVCYEVTPKSLPPELKDSCYFIKPLKSNSNFTYSAKIDREKGLYYLREENVIDPMLGGNPKSNFRALKAKLSKKYGRPERRDRILMGEKNSIIKEWPYFNKGSYVFWEDASSVLPCGVGNVSLCLEPYGLGFYSYSVSITFKADFFDECESKLMNRLFGLGKLKKGMSEKDVLSILGPQPIYNPICSYYYNTKYYNGLYSVEKTWLDPEINKEDFYFLEKLLSEKYGKPEISEKRDEKKKDPLWLSMWNVLFCWSSDQLPDSLYSVMLSAHPKVSVISPIGEAPFTISVEYRFKCNAEINPLSNLKMGMTVEEVEKACGGEKPYHCSKDVYEIKPNCHPDFDFKANIDSEKGLYFIEE